MGFKHSISNHSISCDHSPTKNITTYYRQGMLSLPSTAFGICLCLYLSSCQSWIYFLMRQFLLLTSQTFKKAGVHLISGCFSHRQLAMTTVACSLISNASNLFICGSDNRTRNMFIERLCSNLIYFLFLFIMKTRIYICFFMFIIKTGIYWSDYFTSCEAHRLK